MEINYSKFIQELVQRTLANYKYIKCAVANPNLMNTSVRPVASSEQDVKLYEVTQLINSMYSLLVVPEEIFGIRQQSNKQLETDKALKTEFSTREAQLKEYDEYNNILNLIEELKSQHRLFYEEDKDTINYKTNYPVCSFLYNLRNSLCHDGIGFLPLQIDYGGKPTNKIDDIIFEAKSIKNKNIDKDIAFLSVLSVTQLENLLMYISAMYCKVEDGKRNINEKKYKDFYTKLKKDVQNLLPDFEF